MQIIRAGAAYFGLVFGAGFVLGPVRMFFLVPRVGERIAELMEVPVMLVVVFVAARWVVNRFQLRSHQAKLGAGAFAVALMLLGEFGVVLKLRALTLAEYLMHLDPVAATAYYLSLLIMSCAPLLFSVPNPIVKTLND